MHSCLGFGGLNAVPKTYLLAVWAYFVTVEYVTLGTDYLSAMRGHDSMKFNETYYVLKVWDSPHDIPFEKTFRSRIKAEQAQKEYEEQLLKNGFVQTELTEVKI